MASWETKKKSSTDHTEPNIPSRSSAVSVLESGTEFTTFFESTLGISSRKLFFFFEAVDGPVMGAIYWCEVCQRTKKDNNRLPFARISDIFVGKQTPILQSELANSANPKCCFSLMAGKSWGLHLAAENESIQQAWLAGIRAIFANSGKAVTDAIPATATSTPPLPSGPEAVAQFEAGRDFIWYANETEVKAGTIHRVSLFYMADTPGMEKVKFGRLFIAERGSRSLVNPLQLNQLSNVYVGKHADKIKLWLQRHTKGAAPSALITLEFKSGQVVGLEATNAHDAQVLTAMLYQIFGLVMPSYHSQ